MESLTSIKYKLTDYYNEKDPSILKNEKKEREILKNLNLLTRFSLDANSKHDKLLSKAYDLKNQQSQAQNILEEYRIELETLENQFQNAKKQKQFIQQQLELNSSYLGCLQDNCEKLCGSIEEMQEIFSQSRQMQEGVEICSERIFDLKQENDEFNKHMAIQSQIKAKQTLNKDELQKKCDEYLIQLNELQAEQTAKSTVLFKKLQIVGDFRQFFKSQHNDAFKQNQSNQNSSQYHKKKPNEGKQRQLKKLASQVEETFYLLQNINSFDSIKISEYNKLTSEIRQLESSVVDSLNELVDIRNEIGQINNQEVQKVRYKKPEQNEKTLTPQVRKSLRLKCSTMKEFKDDTSSKKRNEDQPLMRAFTECDDEEEKSVSVNGPMKKIQETRNLDKSTNSFKLDFSQLEAQHLENFALIKESRSLKKTQQQQHQKPRGQLLELMEGNCEIDQPKKGEKLNPIKMLAYIKDDDEEGLDDFCLANVSRRSFVPKSKRSFGRESKHSFLPEMCGKESEKQERGILFSEKDASVSQKTVSQNSFQQTHSQKHSFTQKSKSSGTEMDKSFKMQPTMTLREELSNFHFEEYQFSMKDNQESHEEDQFMEEPKPETDLMYQSQVVNPNRRAEKKRSGSLIFKNHLAKSEKYVQDSNHKTLIGSQYSRTNISRFAQEIEGKSEHEISCSVDNESEPSSNLDNIQIQVLNDATDKSNSKLMLASNRSINLLPNLNVNQKPSTFKRDLILSGLGVGTAISAYFWYKKRQQE